MNRILLAALLAFTPASGLFAGEATLGELKVTFAAPEGWSAIEGVTGFADLAGNKGSVQMMATPIPVDPSAVDMMNQASFTQGEARVKAGELATVEWKEVDGVKGVLTVESGKDSIQRMQWIAFAKGHNIIVTMASEPAAFEGYRASFDAFLGSLKWGP